MRLDTTRLAILVIAVLVTVGSLAVVPATAEPASADRTATDATIAPGASTTVTVTATMDASGGPLTLNDAFSGEVQSASIQSVTVDGDSANTIISEAESNGTVVTLSSTGETAEVKITYKITATDTTGNITITGELTGGDATINLGTTNIAVEKAPLTASQSVADSELDVGGTTTVTTTVTNPTSKVTVNHTFAGPVVNATNPVVTVNNETVSPIIGAADATGSVVTLAELSAKDTVEVTTDLTAADDATVNETVTISGQVTSNESQVMLSQKTVPIVDPDPVNKYAGSDGKVDVIDLGTAAVDYANEELSLTELAEIAAAYTS